MSVPGVDTPSGVGQGGKAAAETVLDMRETGNFSRAAAQAYERRWMKAYGHDFELVCHGLPVLCPAAMEL